MIHVRIPATSANLGAGFDALGLSLTLYNDVYLELSEQTSIEALDHTAIPTDETNLVFTSARRVFEMCASCPVPGFYIRQRNRIPIARGLGSSSACIVAGLVGANRLLGDPLAADDLLSLAAGIEGHPDNVAPALLGGIVTSVYDGDRVFYVKQDTFARLCFYAIVPDFEIATELARKALPARVLHEDAVFNLSRAALFSASLLQGKYENLKVAAQDRLHQPYRLGMIPSGEEVFRACYSAGAYAVYISGAGPTIIAICDEADNTFCASLRDLLDTLGLSRWEILQMTIDNRGVQTDCDLPPQKGTSGVKTRKKDIS